MKVSDLIEELKKLPEDSEAWMSDGDSIAPVLGVMHHPDSPIVVIT
jgi:hypothetical protein